MQTEKVRQFQERVMSYPDCDKLMSCVNCGTCTSSCGSKAFMTYGPRGMVRAIINGDIETVKKSGDPWLCIECFMCEIKCPREVKPVYIMRALREIQFEDNDYPELAPKVAKAKKLQKIFVDQIAHNGRLSEFHAALDYKGLLGSMKEISTGLDLIRTGRIKITELVKTGLSFTLAGSSYKIEDKKSRQQVNDLMKRFYTVNIQ